MLSGREFLLCGSNAVGLGKALQPGDKASQGMMDPRLAETGSQRFLGEAMSANGGETSQPDGNPSRSSACVWEGL